MTRVQPHRTGTATIAPITVEAPRAAPAPKHRKPAARPHEGGSRYAAYREGHYAGGTVPRTENGHAYGVSPAEARAERLGMQRGWGGDFGHSRYRF